MTVIRQNVDDVAHLNPPAGQVSPQTYDSAILCRHEMAGAGNCIQYCSGVTRRGGGRTAPGDTLQGLTPEGKNFMGNLQRIVEKRGRTGEKGVGDTLEGVTPE